MADAFTSAEYQFGTHQRELVDTNSRSTTQLFDIAFAATIMSVAAMHLLNSSQFIQQEFNQPNSSEVYGPVPPTAVVNTPSLAKFSFSAPQHLDIPFAQTYSATPPSAQPPPLTTVDQAAPQQYDVGYGTLFKPAQYLNVAIVWQINGEQDPYQDVQPWVRGPLPPSAAVVSLLQRSIITGAPQQSDVANGFSDVYGQVPPTAVGPTAPPLQPVYAPAQQWGDYNYSVMWSGLTEQLQLPLKYTTLIIPPQQYDLANGFADAYGPVPPTQAAQSPLLRGSIFATQQQYDQASGVGAVYKQAPLPLSSTTILSQLFSTQTFVEQNYSSQVKPAITALSIFVPHFVTAAWLQDADLRYVPSTVFKSTQIPITINNPTKLTLTTYPQELVTYSYGIQFASSVFIPNVVPHAPPLAPTLSIPPQQYDIGYGVIESPLQVILVYPGRTRVTITTKLTHARILPDDIA